MSIEEDVELDRTIVKDAARVAISRYTDRVEVAKLPLIRSRSKRQDKMASIYREAIMSAPFYMISGLPHVYVYEEGRYCPIKWTVFGDAVYEAMRDTGVLDGEFGKLESLTRILIRAITSKEKEIDNSIVVMSNGVYDTKKHKFHGHSKKYISVSKTDYKYDATAECPLWEAFLDEVLPTKEHQALLQECIAAAYIDRSEAKIEHVTILKGDGANGKSVVFSTLLKVLGEQNVSTFSISDLINSKREQNIAACNGKRMNYCSEIRTTEIDDSNADAFKALVSGEPTMARALYREPFVARNIPILFANANVLPRVADPSNSIRRRLIVLPFLVTIPPDKQDRELPAKLESEASGIFNWVMSGLMRLQAGGYMLHIPQEIKNLVDNYMLDNNTVARWLADSRFFSKANEVSDSEPTNVSAFELYNAYKAWCSKLSENPVTSSKLGRVMSEMSFNKIRRGNGMYYQVYVGLSDEEVRIRSLQELLAAESEKMASMEDKMIDAKKGITIVGIPEVERYLGLQEGSVLYYYQKALLDGTFTMSRGRPRFFVRMLQKRLSSLGYYNRLNRFGRYASDNDINSATKSITGFNNQMYQLSLPLYKRPKKCKTTPTKYRGLIEMPEDWVFNLDDVGKLIQENRDRLGETFNFFNESYNKLKKQQDERKKAEEEPLSPGDDY